MYSSDLYRTLDELKLSPDDVENTVRNGSDAFLLDAHRHVLSASKQLHDKPKHIPFSFTANSRLSGRSEHCQQRKCRLAAVEHTSRFAALYADRVLLLNPFRRIESKSISSYQRGAMVDDILVAHAMKPLIEAGIVRFYSREFTMCKACSKTVLETEGVKDRVEKAGNILFALYSEKVSATVARLKDFEAEFFDANWRITFEGPRELLDHGGVTSHLKTLPEGIAEGDRRLLSKDEVRLLVHGGLLRHPWIISQDFFSQSLHAQFGYSYLSDREIDVSIASAVDGNSQDEGSAALSSLTHTVPTAFQVSVSNLLQFRRNEGEAFHVYRDRLHQVLTELRTLGPLSKVELQGQFRERIDRELHLVEKRIRDEAEIARISLASDSVALGALSFAYFSGVFPDSALQLLTSLGGFALGTHTMHNIKKLVATTEPRKSDLFFLWKVQNISQN